jgi:hypothetical protein
MSALPGLWAVTMTTPIGRIEARMSFTEHPRDVSGTASGSGGSGGFTGSAEGRGETVPLADIRTVVEAGAERVTWRQSITKPIKLDLVFDVTLDGDEMHGHSRAGRLPRSTVTGRRVVE